MDFIMELPVTKHGHDAIWVCNDRIARSVPIAATNTFMTAEGAALLFIHHVWMDPGLAMDMITDHEPRLYW